MQQFAAFIEKIDQYCAGLADIAALRSAMIEQASRTPQLVGAMMEAVGAAERAGEMRPDAARELLAWLAAHQAAPGDSNEQQTQPTIREPDSAAPPPTPLESVVEGSVLKNRYLLERKIGEGGMGYVFRARDLEEERIASEHQGSDIRQYLAIKVLRPDRYEFRVAVLEEVRNTRVLVHQNIVRAGDCQQDGNTIFMTMEYLEGRTLDALLDQDFARGMPWDRAFPIITGMANGLAYAHDKGLVHCDFKPSNVFITHAFAPKILDFGIARAARGGGQQRSSGVPVGMTPRYASPAMIGAWNKNGMADYLPDRRDDIFALACVVFELLTGHHPFDPQDALQAQQSGLPVPAIKGLSARQNSALAKALALDREQRTARVEDFIAQFSPAAPAPMTPGRSRLIRGVLAAVILTAATAAIYLLLSPRQTNLLPAATPAAAPDAPRHVRLGSTNAEIQAAFTLCQRYAGSTAPACSLDWYADESARDSTLSPFELDAGPVTLHDFRQFAEANHYQTQAERTGHAYRFTTRGLVRADGGSWRNAVSSTDISDQSPVVAVDFDAAQAYCRSQGKRLPTEDEWEYIAREPAPVSARYRDMTGVVWQWVDTDHALMDEQGRAVIGKILKGGSSHDTNPANLRPAVRRYAQLTEADDVTGFRCASNAASWPDADASHPLERGIRK